MNKKVLGAVLGSCLFLCGDYVECVSHSEMKRLRRNDVADLDGFYLRASGKDAQKKGVVKTDKGVFKYEALIGGGKFSIFGVNFSSVSDFVSFYSTVYKKSLAEVQAAFEGRLSGSGVTFEKAVKISERIAEINNESAKKRDEYMKYKKGGNFIIKPSSSPAPSKSKEEVKKETELKAALDELNMLLVDKSISGVNFSDIASVETVRGIKGNMESGRYGAVEDCSSEIFERVVKLDVGMQSDDVLAKLVNRGGDKVALVNNVNKDNVGLIWKIFNESSNNMVEGIDVGQFVEGIGVRFLVKGWKDEEAIRKVIADKVIEEREAEILEALEKIIEKDVAKKYLENAKTVEDCNKMCEEVKSRFNAGCHKKLYAGLVCPVEEKVKIVVELLALAKRSNDGFDKIWNGEDYVSPMTAKLALEYSELSDGDDKQKIAENLIAILKCNGGTLKEKYDKYKEDIEEKENEAKLEEVFRNDCFGRLKLEMADCKDSTYGAALKTAVLDEKFAAYVKKNVAKWVSDSDGERVDNLSSIVSLVINEDGNAGVAKKKLVFFVVCAHEAFCNANAKSIGLDFLKDVVKIVGDEGWYGVKINLQTSGFVSAFNEAKVYFGFSNNVPVVKKVVTEVVSDIKSKVGLDFEGALVVDDDKALVSIGSLKYNSGDALSLLCGIKESVDRGIVVVYDDNRDVKVEDFNRKDAAEKQAYLNEVAKESEIKPVELKAE